MSSWLSCDLPKISAPTPVTALSSTAQNGFEEIEQILFKRERTKDNGQIADKIIGLIKLSITLLIDIVPLHSFI